MTAAEDRIIARNPCRIRGGDDEKPPERPVLTIAQVLDLTNYMAAHRYRALILLATFASLRWGEAIALRRCDLDLTARTVSIAVNTWKPTAISPSRRPSPGPLSGPSPFRQRSCPSSASTWTPAPGPRAPRWCSPASGAACSGAATSARHPAGLSPWPRSGCPGCTFTICGTPATPWRPRPGVSLADLKARMGHNSVRAVMIYQHAAAEADQKIANTLDQRMEEVRDDARDQS